MVRFTAGFFAGLAGWTLLEYVIHSWLGHLPKGRILISAEHLKHHGDILYFTPLRLKLRGALPVLATLLLLVGGACGLPTGLGFVVAVALGWTAYELLHQSIHVHGPRGPYTRWAARHHLAHHFARPGANHGVTTPIWDLLLGTYVHVRRVPVPRRFRTAVPWLASADDTEDGSRLFRADYDVT